MLFHDQPHSLSVTHSLTLTSALLCAGGWSRKPPKDLPTKLSSVCYSNTRGSKNQFINPLFANQTNSLPHDILTRRLKACEFSCSATYHHKTTQSHLRTVQSVPLPCFFQSEWTHNTWIPSAFTQTDLPMDKPVSL